MTSSRLPGESSTEFQARVLDKVSPSFCAAKWYNATIWLGSGQTASCHHPLPHQIDRRFLVQDPSSLHNTPHKVLRRKEMLNGVWPKECEYCSLIETKSKAISDRVSQSDFYSSEDLGRISKTGDSLAVNPKVLEIAFDRICNMACSYCNPGYSSKWANDIRNNGPYLGLQSDGGKTYQQKGDWADSANQETPNVYVEAFWKWWPELRKDLLELRVTGGEPLVSPDFYRFVELFRQQPPSDKMLFAVNSNLSHSWEKILNFLDRISFHPNIGIYTSCEAQGLQAEYIRDGLNYPIFISNLKNLLDLKRLSRLQLMSTVSALSVYSLTEFLDDILELKAKHGVYMPSISVNIVRFPSFMSPSVLPVELRMERAEHLMNWLSDREKTKLLWHAETDGIRRVIEYLKEVESPHDRSSALSVRQKDFKNFFMQFDRRRQLNFESTFPKNLVDWYSSLPSDIQGENVLFESNAASGYHGGANGS